MRGRNGIVERLLIQEQRLYRLRTQTFAYNCRVSGGWMKTTRRQALLSGAAIATAAALPFQKDMAANPEPSNSSKPSADQIFADAVSLSDFEGVAHERMSHMAWEYINSGAADEITLRWNREAFDRIRLNPRVLRDTSALNTKVKVLGQELPFTVILAPTSLHKLAHP